MKIGNGSGLLERMKAAHTEGVQAGAEVAAFDAAAPTSAPASTGRTTIAPQADPPTGIKRAALEIARDVIDGKFGADDKVRSRSLDAIVVARVGDALSRPERKRASKMLEVTLAQDPKFKAELDEMLVLASRELHTLPSE